MSDERNDIALSTLPAPRGDDGFNELHLEVSLTPNPALGGEGMGQQMRQGLSINGQPLTTEFSIELSALAKSCQLSGAFWMVTCGCGEPGCAGIDDPITVEQWQDAIIWAVPSPLSTRGLRDFARNNPGAYRGTVSYRFDPDRYTDTVLAGLRRAKMLLVSQTDPVACSPFGVEPEELLALDPRLFEQRAPTADAVLLPKRVEIDRAGLDITMNGMSFALASLPLPPEILALADWSEWEPLVMGAGAFYNYAAAPQWERRRRARLLARHLASRMYSDSIVEIADGGSWHTTRRGDQFRLVEQFQGRIRGCLPVD